MHRAVLGLLACGVLSTASGCALTISAIAHHNSRGTACIDEPAYTLIDLGIGGVAAAAIVANDEGGTAWIVPGVFLGSAVLGTIELIGCRRPDPGRGIEAPPASNSAPSFGDAEVDRSAREATPEERGVVPSVPAESPAVPLRVPVGGVDLRIDPTFVEQHPPSTPSSPSDAGAGDGEGEPRIACGHAPGTACPDGQVCAIAGADAGYCVLRSER